MLGVFKFFTKPFILSDVESVTRKGFQIMGCESYQIY
jgi:hypothetical protein